MPTSSDFHPRSGFKRRRICLPFLPKEIIFKILLRLPVDILHNAMRYVCREWYNIIKDPIFTDAHLQQSPTGFLTQFPHLNFSTLYLEMREHDVEITDLNVFPEGRRDGKGFNFFQPPFDCSYEYNKFPGRVLASCNGLVLVSDCNLPNCYYVANLILRQWVILPPLIGNSLTWLNAGLGYANSCEAYKVAYMYYSVPGCHHCAILTLGVDKGWRCIASSNDVSGIPQKERNVVFMGGKTLSTGGYIHWVYSNYVLSLEVETESFYVSVVPNECSAKRKYFLAMESCLSFASVWEKYIFQLLALVDVEAGHWKKLQKIDLAAQIPVLEQQFGLSITDFRPLSLLKKGELFVLRVSDNEEIFIICNVKTRAVDYFKSDSCDALHIRCFPFVQSLVSPKLEMKEM